MKSNFLNHNRFFSFRFSALLTLVLLLIYIFDSPVGGHRGSTFYGYTVGVISTLGIIILSMYGVRKRSYNAYGKPLKAWLSFHVWFGSFLIVLVPLHSGFQFGINIHTATYLIMVGVVLTGMLGAYLYRVLPIETSSNHGGASMKKLGEQISLLKSEIEQISKNEGSLPAIKKLLPAKDYPSNFSILFGLFGTRTKPLTKDKLISLLEQKDKNILTKGDVANSEAEQILNLNLSSSITKSLTKLLELNSKLIELEEEISVLLQLRIWLYMHVPLAMALVIFLALHIVTVFYYRA